MRATLRDHLPEALGVAAVAIVLCLVGWFIWSEITEPTSGTVTGLDYSPPYISSSCTGKPLHCSTTYYPECYEVDYADSDGAKGDDCVAPNEFPLYRVGDHFPRSQKKVS